MPEVSKICAISRKKRSLQKEFRINKLAYPYIGKTIMVIDDAVHYMVGMDSNPKQNIANINNIYKIKPAGKWESKEEMFKLVIWEMFDMLKNYHIRSNNTESVRPYPFKLLMELVRMKNPGANLYF